MLIYQMRKKNFFFKEVVCLNSPACKLRDQNWNLALCHVKALSPITYHLITTLNWVKTEFIHFQQKQRNTDPLVSLCDLIKDIKSKTLISVKEMTEESGGYPLWFAQIPKVPRPGWKTCFRHPLITLIVS